MQPPDPTAGANRWERALWWLALALAGAAVVVLAALVAQRFGHPYELEWMEGAMVDHTLRVHRGLGVYTAPGVDHVAYLYTPLLYYLGSLAMHLVGESYQCVRLVSICGTVLTAAMIHALVRHETGSRRAGLLAAGLFCAGYGMFRTWYDLGRSDLLFQGLFLAAVLLLRRGRTVWTAVAAGVVWDLAFLSKQVATFWLPMLAAMALLLGVRRGIQFCISAGVCFVATVLAWDLATDGWFSFFVFVMPRKTGSTPEHWLGYWTTDIVPTLPLLAAAAIGIAGRWRTQRREALATGAFLLGGLLTSYASRVHAGGFENALIYGFAALCCAGPAALASAAGTRLHRWVLPLLTLQFVLLVVDVRAAYGPRETLLYDPSRYLPRPMQSAASERLVAWLRDQPGPVWSVFHGHIATLAGKPTFAHALAIGDMLHYSTRSPADDRAVVAMTDSMRRALKDHEVWAVQLDEPLGAVFEKLFAGYLDDYERVPLDLYPDPTALCSVVGMPTFSPYALVLRR